MKSLLIYKLIREKLNSIVQGEAMTRSCFHLYRVKDVCPWLLEIALMYEEGNDGTDQFHLQ